MKMLRLGLAGAVSATLVLLGGCSVGDTAAVVNGTRISEREAQVTATMINEVASPSTPWTTRTVVNAMVMAPAVLSYGRENGLNVSQEVARSQLSNFESPTPYLIDIVREQMVLGQLTVEQQGELVQRLAKEKISINPRYGIFDPATADMTDATPDWIIDSSAQ